MLKKIYILIPFLLIFTACSEKSPIKNEIVYSQIEYEKITKYDNEKVDIDKKIVQEPIITPEDYKKMLEDEKKASNDLNSDEEITKALMDFYSEWKNVRYRFGGTSKKGIDCSAFTQRVFKEKFNIKIPRSTRYQVKSGTAVKKSDLKLGDLVFFKTGKIDRHVGIYMGDGKFMHASIKGIKLTNLDKPFYKKTYWTSRRVMQ